MGLVDFGAIVLLDILGVAGLPSVAAPSVRLLADLNRHRFVLAHQLRGHDLHLVASIATHRLALLEVALVGNGLRIRFFIALLKSIAAFGRFGVARFFRLPGLGSTGNKGQCEDDKSRFHFVSCI